MLDMGASIRTAKLNPPKLIDIYTRENLISQLELSMHKPLVWISGPAGSGKTTLVADYIAQKELPVIWYQMDAADTDPASFFYYMGLAAKRNGIRKKNPLPILSPEMAQNIEKFSINFFRELFARLKQPGLIVLDQYQDCAPDSITHEALVQGLNEIPEGSHVIFISRDDPPPAYARLRASNYIHFMNADDLLVNQQECFAICSQRYPENKAYPSLSQQQVDIAWKLTNGWITGLVLMLEQIYEQRLSETTEFSDNQVIFDYFAGEIFQRNPPQLKEFMLKISLIPTITPEIACIITGDPRASRVLNDLSRKNCFIQKQSGNKGSYQFQPLFREFLIDQAQSKLGKYEVLDIQRKAAAILAEEGEAEQAVSLFQHIEDWHSIAKVIIGQGEVLLEAGLHKTMVGWLDKIPDNITYSTPWLQYWKGVCNQPFNLQISRKFFIQAYEQFKRKEELEGVFLSWLGVVETYIIEWGNFKPLDRWIDDMDTMLAHGVKFPSPQIAVRVAAGMFAALMYRKPDHPNMPIWEEKLVQAMPQIRDASTQIKLGFQLFFYYTIWRGDLPKATMIVDILKPASRRLRDPAILALWHALEGLFLWKRGEHQASLDSIKHGLKLSEEAGFHLWDTLLYSSGVYACLSLDKQKLSNEYLEKMSASLDPKRLWDVGHYHYILGRIYLFKEKHYEALEHCEAGLKAVIAAGSPYGEALLRTIYSQALFRTHQKEKAVAVNNMLLDSVIQIRARNMQYFALMNEAEFAYDMQSEKRACKALRAGFEIAREQDLIKHAFWWPPIMADLCVKALEENIETEFVQKVVQVRELAPATPPVHLDNWPWKIKIFTLGRFAITLDSQPVAITGKAHKRPLELLKVLLSLGGRQIDQNRVIEHMWPDAEGDSATQSLHTTLHRLRKILGDRALTLQNAYLTIDSRFVWVDIWSWERTYNLLDRILKRVPSSENIAQIEQLGEKVMKLYQGEFLTNEAECYWSLPLQQKLKNRFLRLICDMGQYWGKLEQWDNAINCYMRGLEIDTLSEKLYQYIMHAYQQVDRQADAANMYHQCRQNLSDSLGVSPSAKTVALYKDISGIQ